MRTIPLSQAKTRLPGLVKKVEATDEGVVITKKGRAAAVLVSAEDYESWAEYESRKETAAIRADKDLMREIRKGIKARKTKLYTIDELLKG